MKNFYEICDQGEASTRYDQIIDNTHEVSQRMYVIMR